MLPPILFVLQLPGGPVPIYTYGFARGVAIIVAVAIWRVGFRRRDLDPDHAYMALLWIAPLTLLASASFGLGSAAAGMGDTDAIDTLLRDAVAGGGSSLIALPVALLAMLQYATLYGLPTPTALDVAAMSAAAALPLQRVGCLAAGCCYGAPTDRPWAVTYTFHLLGEAGPPIGVPIHPTQIYEAAATLLLLSALWFITFRRHHDGTTFWAFVGGYAAIRFVVDALRDDPHPLGEWNGLWAVHVLYAVAIAVAATRLHRLRRDRT